MSHPSDIQEALAQALAHQEANQLDDAEAIYRRILAHDPNQPGIRNNLSNILKDTGRIDQAVEECRRALALDPQNAEIHSSLCYKLHFHPDYDSAAILRELSEWDRRHGRPIAAGHSNDRSPDRRLRVGYVSPDFYGHAECFFVLPLLKSHDRRAVEVHCYSSVRRPDKATDLLKSCADVWHDSLALSDEHLAEQIRHDKIDILVDLTMHMAFNRLAMFARKPAPVQITWLAYPGGTGVRAIDYRLTDARMDPPTDGDKNYAEKSIRLPNGWCCYHPLGDVPPAAARPDVPVTFGSLNNPCKLNEPTLRLWARILTSLPDSHLLLLTKSQNHRAHIASTFAEAGINPDRIEFTSPCRRGDYLRLYDRIDLCLDPLPYNGITTTCDALWMGVPVITRIGSTAPGRAGLSILSTLELPELIADNNDQFIQIASNLVNDYPQRRILRSTLRDRMTRSPLMDAARFARDVEAAYQHAWRRSCAV